MWLLVPGPPTTGLATDPIPHLVLVELLRSVPFVTVLGAVASLLALAFWAGVGRARRPLQAVLIVGALAPVALGLRLTFLLPLPEGLSSPRLWRLLFSTPALVGALFSGVPAGVAVWLLEKPAARRWTQGL